ncbi:hypothetical protein DY000_02024065 [Brassica cretica]|uniref:Uncharacterized protein n=1 Tax=Brassica cretica TaxID=69181 RepID=A0ABQ7E6L6_BRACR|nr:hypothetical protein DY000_02024065 [Brassica cretica]
MQITVAALIGHPPECDIIFCWSQRKNRESIGQGEIISVDRKLIPEQSGEKAGERTVMSEPPLPMSESRQNRCCQSNRFPETGRDEMKPQLEIFQLHLRLSSLILGNSDSFYTVVAIFRLREIVALTTPVSSAFAPGKWWL